MKKKKLTTKDYMLRSRLSSLEKIQLEMIIKYYEMYRDTKLTKVDVFRYLINREFETLQMDIVKRLEPISY